VSTKSPARGSEGSAVKKSCLIYISAFAVLCLLAPRMVRSQGVATLSEQTAPFDTWQLTQTSGRVEPGVEPGRVAKTPPESELIIEGLASYGNYKIFASGRDCKLYTAGVEYDRHSWGHFLKARVDYVAEILPVVILNEPADLSDRGFIQGYARKTVPGLAISPIGFRMQWRDNKKIKPYLEEKGGILAFPQKVPTRDASYENFSLQSVTGVQVQLSDRWGLRLGLFGDFHFSNGFIVPVNPGLDVMNASLGLSYHIRRKSD